jgi:hypothetical protein
MEMKKINSGRLRAIGYDARVRMPQVELGFAIVLSDNTTAARLGMSSIC